MSLEMQVLRSPVRVSAIFVRSFSSSTRRYALKPPHPRGRVSSPRRTPGTTRRPPLSAKASSQRVGGTQESNDKVSDALRNTANGDVNNLVSPVHIPADPHGMLHSGHPAISILANSSIVVQRQIEMMNVFLGFEQANKYVIMDPQGNHIGYLAEQDHGIGSTMVRQLAGTHRSFTTHVFDRNEREILRFHRPFSWISSRIRIYDAVQSGSQSHSASTALQGTSAGSLNSDTSTQTSSLALSDMRIIGEAHQEWAPLRRKYNLFLHRPLADQSRDPEAPQLTAGDLPLSNSTAVQVYEGSSEQIGIAQFAHVNEPFLSWDFSLMSSDDRLIGSVNRNFAGFAREIFTDTGVYALRMDAVGLAAEPRHLISRTGNTSELTEQPTTSAGGMTLDQRAVMLATAVSIDFDYFSRHSGVGGGFGFMPMWLPWGMGGGGAAAEGGAVGGAASEAGGAVGGVGNVVKGVGAGEGAAVGAGTMAGYEAMQGGRGGADDASPTSDQPIEPGQNQDDDFWGGFGGGGSQGGSSQGGGGSNGGGSSGDSGGGDGGGDGGFDIGDWF